VGFAFFWIWLHAICKTLLCLNCFSSMNSSHCIWFQKLSCLWPTSVQGIFLTEFDEISLQIKSVGFHSQILPTWDFL
jgi:hypothetical protein